MGLEIILSRCTQDIINRKSPLIFWILKNPDWGSQDMLRGRGLLSVTDLLVNYFNQETKCQISKQKRKNDEKQFQTFILIKNQNRQNKLIFNFSNETTCIQLFHNPCYLTVIQHNAQISKTMNNYPRPWTAIQDNVQISNQISTDQSLNSIWMKSK